MQLPAADIRLQHCCPIDISLSTDMVLLLKVETRNLQVDFHLEVRTIVPGVRSWMRLRVMYATTQLTYFVIQMDTN